MSTQAFITGSHAYGYPTEESDVDLVIYTSDTKVHQLLEEHFKTEKGSLRADKLNIILCKSKVEYDVWLEGTNKLITVAEVAGPVNKKVATAFLDKLRLKAGIKSNYNGRVKLEDKYDLLDEEGDY